MRGDREVFDSIEAFSRDITREALHNFEQLRIKARGGSYKVVVTFSRNPHLFRRGQKGDHGVLLRVQAKGARAEPSIARVGERLARAIDRGRPWKAPKANTGFGPDLPGRDKREYWGESFARMPTAFAPMLLSAFFLYAFAGISNPWYFWGLLIGSVLAGVLLAGLILMYLTNWLFPAVEVAPHGDTHAWRMVKWLFILAVGVLLTKAAS
jgi:hypothetical protein